MTPRPWWDSGAVPAIRRLPSWVAAAWLVGLGAVCCALLLVTYAVAVHTRRGRLLDGSSLRGAVDARSGVNDVVEMLLNAVSVVSLLGAAVVLALIALARLRRELALAAVAVVVGSNVTTQVLKRFVFDRPDLGIEESTPATLNSLPSGHSTVAFSVAVALVLVLPVRLRAPAAGVGVGYATLTALATLSAGWHRPSDSVAAFLVVACWAALVGLVLVVLHARSGSPVEGADGTHGPTSRRLARVAGYLLAFGVLVALVVVTTRLDTYNALTQVLAYAAGAGVIAGTSAAVMAALLTVMHRVAPAVLGTASSEEPAPREEPSSSVSDPA
jgi:membrane-associated phospholipid phosphatase